MKFADAQTFVNAGLTGLGYGTANHPALPLLHPGPPSVQRLWTLSPNAIVFLTVGNGIVETTEGLYDRPFLVVRVIGTQNDYTSAETLAYDIDKLCVEFTAGAVGSSRSLYITRNAPPQLVDLDASDRYHFQTTYIMETKR